MGSHKIFLCHAHEDKSKALEIYRLLKTEGLKPWLDSEDLLPGQNWRREIPSAIRGADFVLIIFSKTSVSKRGYVQAELKLALDVLAEIPDDKIFVIPVRLDDCEVPGRFKDLHYCDLFEEGGIRKVLAAINSKADGPSSVYARNPSSAPAPQSQRLRSSDRPIESIKSTEWIKLKSSRIVRSAVLRPDSKLLASGGDDKLIKVWDVNSREEVHSLLGHSCSTKALHFDADEEVLVSAGYSDKVLKWDLLSGDIIDAVPFSGVNTLAFNKDGSLLAARNFSRENNVVLLETSSCKERKTLSEYSSQVNSSAFSPVDSVLAVGHHDGAIKLWNTEAGGKMKPPVLFDPGIVHDLSFSPSGSILASCGSNFVNLRSTGSWKVAQAMAFRGTVTSVAFGLDDSLLVTGSLNGEISLWRLECE